MPSEKGFDLGESALLAYKTKYVQVDIGPVLLVGEEDGKLACGSEPTCCEQPGVSATVCECSDEFVKGIFVEIGEVGRTVLASLGIEVALFESPCVAKPADGEVRRLPEPAVTRLGLRKTLELVEAHGRAAAAVENPEEDASERGVVSQQGLDSIAAARRLLVAGAVPVCAVA